MGLSSDPEKRQRQLDALAGGRGLSQDPEKRGRQLANLAEGRAKRHGPAGDDPPAQPASEPVKRARGRRVVRGAYEEERPKRDPSRRREAAHKPPEPVTEDQDEGPERSGAWDRLDRIVN